MAAMLAESYGHRVVALANLLPADADVEELDSHCFQTVGHRAVASYGDLTGLPLFRRRLRGSSMRTDISYEVGADDTLGDEVEDLRALLAAVVDASSARHRGRHPERLPAPPRGGCVRGPRPRLPRVHVAPAAAARPRPDLRLRRRRRPRQGRRHGPRPRAAPRRVPGVPPRDAPPRRARVREPLRRRGRRVRDARAGLPALQKRPPRARRPEGGRDLPGPIRALGTPRDRRRRGHPETRRRGSRRGFVFVSGPRLGSRGLGPGARRNPGRGGGAGHTGTRHLGTRSPTGAVVDGRPRARAPRSAPNRGGRRRGARGGRALRLAGPPPASASSSPPVFPSSSAASFARTLGRLRVARARPRRVAVDLDASAAAGASAISGPGAPSRSRGLGRRRTPTPAQLYVMISRTSPR